MANDLPSEAVLEQLLGLWEDAHIAGRSLPVEELCAAWPEYVPEVRRRIAALLAFDSLDPNTLALARTGPAFATNPAPGLPEIVGYEVEREVGRGGMGVIYLGKQLALNRVVAIKTILAGTSASPDQRTRFLLEARAVAQLRHTNIVQVHDVGEVAGKLYLVMEYLSGGNLADALDHRPQPPCEAAALVCVLARAIHHAHEQGIIHRDLKPANVLLASGGRQSSGSDASEGGTGGSRPPLAELIPKITDFGLAKQLDAPSISQSGAVVGTVSYMAPEQARASPQIGPACDIYSLGAILYECLTGRVPFLGADYLDVLQCLLHQEPILPRRLSPGIPRDLETICLKCLEKEPHRRYSTASDLADDLQRFLDGDTVRARPIGRLESARRWCVRNPIVAGLSGLVLCAVLAVIGLSIWFSVETAQNARELGQALAQARLRLAETEQARGLGLLEAGETDLGLLWLGRALEHLPPGSDALERELRRTLGQALQSHRPLEQRLDHGQSIKLIAPSPDGKLLLTAGGSRVRLWDAATGQPRGEPFDYGSDVLAACWHPSGREVTLAGAGEKGQPTRIQRLDPTTGRPLQSRLPDLTREPSRAVVALAWNPDGTLLIAGAIHLARPDIGELSVWAAPAFEPVPRPLLLPGAVVALAHHSRQDLLAVLLDRAVGDTTGGRVMLLDPRSGKPGLPPFNLPEKPTLLDSAALAFAPDGASLWTLAGNRLRRWSLDGNLLDALPSPRERSSSLAFHPAGAEVRLTEGAVARGYSPRTGAVLDGPVRHGERITHLLWANAGSRLLTASADHSVSVWGPLPHPVQNYPDRVSAVAFSPNGTRAFTACETGAAHLWLREGTVWRAIALPHASRVDPAFFSGDGAVLLTVSDERKVVRLWDAQTGKPLGEPILHPEPIAQLASSPTEDYFATTCNRQLQVYRTSTGERVGPIAQLTAPAILLQFMSGGSRLLVLTQSVTTGALACEFNVDSLKLCETPQPVPETHGLLFDRLAAGPDGQILGYWADGGHFQVYDRKHNRILYRGAPADGKTTLPAFHPQEPFVVVGTESGRVLGIDWQQGKVQMRLVHGSGLVRALLDSKGESLVTVGSDGAIRQWESASGEVRGTAWRHADAVNRTVAFSPDGRWLLTGSLDGTACLWDRAADARGTAAEVRRLLERRTGLKLTESGQVRHLSIAEWQERP